MVSGAVTTKKIFNVNFKAPLKYIIIIINNCELYETFLLVQALCPRSDIQTSKLKN